MGSSARLVTLVPCVAALVLLASPRGARTGDATLRDRFLREYPGALKALETRFSGARGSVQKRFERVNMPDKARTVPTERFIFERRPDMARVLVERHVKAAGSSDKTTSGDSDMVLCYNHDYTFQLTREGTNREFFVSSFYWNREVKPQQVGVKTLLWVDDYLKAVFAGV